MSKKRNNNNVSIITKMVLALLLLSFLGFSIMTKNDSHLSKLSIKIKTRSDRKYLITKKDVKRILTNELGFDLSIAHINQIDLNAMESALESDDRVSRAEIYINKHNEMVVGVIQNLPIVRVEVPQGEDYYLDAAGDRIPKMGDGVRVPVVTGAVDKYVTNFSKDKDHNLNYILALSKLLYEDEFLSGLVDQIHMDAEDGIVIVPKLGRQHINLGSKEGLDHKIYKLKSYYKNGFKNIGIDKFDRLDLQYEGQIIGSNSQS